MKVLPLCRKKMLLRAWITMCLLLKAVSPESINESLTECEIKALLRQLISPSQEYQLHAAALRNQLRNLLETEQIENLQNLESPQDELTEVDKKSLSSLARNGFLQPGKRYVGALARTGMLRPAMDTYKRSLATLAKNGQFPSQEPEIDDSTQQWEGKRNLGSLAKSGYITGKRNIASLARGYQLPLSAKRNLAALARLGFVPSTTPKRDMTPLARLNLLPNNSYNSKREAKYWLRDSTNNANIKKLENNILPQGVRNKRSPYNGLLAEENMEIPEDVYQNPPLDYEELRDNLDRIDGQYYPDNLQEDKRFLGSVAKGGGWFNSRPIDKRNIGSLARLGLLRNEYSGYGSQKARDSYRQQQEQKRHIGALARSGWLPTFRSVRSGRFSRSGRARSGITPNKSDFDNPSRPFVDDAMIPNYKIQSTGVPLAYNQPGAPLPDSQLYIGEVYDPLETTTELSNYNQIQISTDNNSKDESNNAYALTAGKLSNPRQYYRNPISNRRI